jgi:hypothetical protein
MINDRYHNRSIVLRGIVIAVASLLVLRLFYLQVIDSSKVDFSFYEYGKYSINELYSFELNIKDIKGNIHQFRQFYFYDDNKDSIIKLLSMDGILKASVRFSENGQGRGGKFTIEGTRHLPKLFKELNN